MFLSPTRLLIPTTRFSFRTSLSQKRNALLHSKVIDLLLRMSKKCVGDHISMETPASILRSAPLNVLRKGLPGRISNSCMWLFLGRAQISRRRKQEVMFGEGQRRDITKIRSLFLSPSQILCCCRVCQGHEGACS